MTPPPSLRKRQRPNLKSGLHTLKRAVQVLGSRALPSSRTALGRELRSWRNSLVADLGGPDAVSTQQLALVEKAVTQKLIVDSLDAYVLEMSSLVNKRSRTLWPVVRERVAQVTLLQSILRDLGLERRHQEAFDLAAELAKLHRQPEEPRPAASPTSSTNPTNLTTEEESAEAMRTEAAETVVGSARGPDQHPTTDTPAVVDAAVDAPATGTTRPGT